MIQRFAFGPSPRATLILFVVSLVGVVALSGLLAAYHRITRSERGATLLADSELLGLLPVPLFVLAAAGYGGYAGAGLLGVFAVVVTPALVWIAGTIGVSMRDGRGPSVEVDEVLVGVRLSAEIMGPVGIVGYAIGFGVHFLLS